jgi:hypothetical protein
MISAMGPGWLSCFGGMQSSPYPHQEIPMPYALFDNDAKISKTYPTKDDVWRHAQAAGLVVDNAANQQNRSPQPVLDSDYQIKPCDPDPGEDPKKNEQEASQYFETDSGI